METRGWFITIITVLVIIAGAMLLRFRGDTPEDRTRLETSTKITATSLPAVPIKRQPNLNESSRHKTGDRPAAARTTGTATLNITAIPAATDTQVTAPLMEITGKTLFHTGEPAANVPVVAVRSHNLEKFVATAQTTSQGDGTYKMMVPFQGIHMKVLAQLPGYAVADETIRSPATIAEPFTAVYQDLLLYPVSQIAGQVTDSQGQPVPGAEISVTLVKIDREDQAQSRVLQNYTAVLSDPQGNFILDKLPPWESFVFAQKPGYRLGSTKVQAPATGINISLSTEGIYVAGRIIDRETSRGLAHSAVIMGHINPVGTYPKLLRYRADADEHFMAGPLIPGKYILNAERRGYTLVGGQRLTEIEDKPETILPDLVMHKGYTLTGRVTSLETGEPVAGANVLVRYAVAPPYAVATAVTGEDGYYSISNVAVGNSPNVSVSARAPGLRTYQETPGLYETWLDVPAAADTTLTRDIRMIGEARVQGFVRTPAGEPMPHAHVRVQYSSQDPIAENGENTVSTLSDGSYSLPLAAPGADVFIRVTAPTSRGQSAPLSYLPGETITADIVLTEHNEPPASY